MGKRKVKKRVNPLRKSLNQALLCARNVPGTKGETLQTLIRQALFLEGAEDLSTEVQAEAVVERVPDPLERGRAIVAQINQRRLAIERMVPRAQVTTVEEALGGGPGEGAPPSPRRLPEEEG
jgi:hypothetical protein